MVTRGSRARLNSDTFPEYLANYLGTDFTLGVYALRAPVF